MSVSAFAFDLALQVALSNAPTEFDHRQAEMRGLVLCVRCGKELTNPQDSRVCGPCEEREGTDAEAC